MNNKLLIFFFAFLFLTSSFNPKASAQTNSHQDPRAVGLGEPIFISEEEIIIYRQPEKPKPYQILLEENATDVNPDEANQPRDAFLKLAETKLGRNLDLVEDEIYTANAITLNLLKAEAKKLSEINSVLQITPVRYPDNTHDTITDSLDHLTVEEFEEGPPLITKVVSQELANTESTLTYTITIPSNRTGEDINYSIEDILPSGVTYTPGSMQTTDSDIQAEFIPETSSIIWSGVVPNFEYRYEMSDNISNPNCRMPVSDYGFYYDIYLENDKRTFSKIHGDGISFTVGDYLGVGTEFFGEIIPYQPIFTDDGLVFMNKTADYQHYGFQFPENQNLPDPIEPNGVLSPWWWDMEIVYDYDLNKGVTSVYWTGENPAWLIEFDDIEDWLYESIHMDFEIFAWLETDYATGYPDIIFAYDNVTGNWFDPDLDGITISNGTVGLENAEGTKGYTHIYDSLLPQSGDMICFDYFEVGRDPVVIRFDVTVNDTLVTPENLPGTIITNTAVYSVGESLPENATASFTINDVPIADPQTLGTDEDTALSILLTGSDSYPGDSLIYKITQPANGKALADGTLPNLIYTPNPNYYGTDSFTFTVGDGLATSNPATITITVAPINDPPTLSFIPDQQIEELTALSLTINTSDPDLPGETLTFSLIDPPAGAAIDPGLGSFTWTPNEDQGPETYDVTIQVRDDDDPALCDQEEFAITVTEPQEFVYLPLIIK